jgi:hypothetical protein
MARRGRTQRRPTAKRDGDVSKHVLRRSYRTRGLPAIDPMRPSAVRIASVTVRAPASARSVEAVSVDGTWPVTRSCTTASPGVDPITAAKRLRTVMSPACTKETVRVTIVRAGRGRNSNEPRPDRVSSSTTNPFVSAGIVGGVDGTRTRGLRRDRPSRPHTNERRINGLHVLLAVLR